MSELWISEEEYLAVVIRMGTLDANDTEETTKVLVDFLRNSNWPDQPFELRDMKDGTGVHSFRPVDLEAEDEKFILARRARAEMKRKAAITRKRNQANK